MMEQSTPLVLPRAIELPRNLTYKAVLMRIVSRDEQGRPEDLVVIPDDRPAEVMPNDEYLIGYIDSRLIERD